MRYVCATLLMTMCACGFGAVEFSARFIDGNLVISYTCTDGDQPCGVSLRVEGATADPANPGTMDVNFNAFVDYAYSNPLNFEVGYGHALADPDQAGVLIEPADVFSICAGVLDETGNQAAGPAEATLITIPVMAWGEITISADTLRGPDSGVVGQDGVIGSNLPILVTGECCCYGGPYAQQYIDAGLDINCWCNDYQCRGDIMGDKHILGYRVYTTDLAALAASWKAKIGDANLNPCADVARDKHILGYRVYTTDLAILAENWKKKDADLQRCN